MNWLSILNLIPGVAPLITRGLAFVPRAEAIVTKIEGIFATAEKLVATVETNVNKAAGISPPQQIDPNTGLPIQ